jgi:secreted trypsin-like serine protease
VTGVLLTFGVLAAAGAQARAVPARAGGALAPQIIGGRPVTSGFGMMAFVINNLGADQEALCTGTVLSSNVVLTAGHCGESVETGMPYPASQFTVITGARNWSAPIGPRATAVSQVIVNPGYDPATTHDDASLLVLSTPTTAPAVSLATQPSDANWLLPGTPVVAAGWGQTTPAGTASTTLQQAATVIQSDSFCAAGSAELGVAFDPGSQLCAIDAPSDTTATCHGDSGGPVLAEQDGAVVELGIISFADPNCAPTQASFMTRADAIAAWAEGEVAALQPPAPAPVTTPTPNPTPPAATSSAKLPRAGTYSGHSSQRLPVTLRVTNGRHALSRARFTVRLRCTGGHRRTVSFRPLRGGHWALGRAAGLGFSRAFRRANGGRYRVSGRFTTAGSATGRVSVTFAAQHSAVCSSGTVRWTARLGG